MSDSSKNFALRRLDLTVEAPNWGVAVVCPIACTQVVIENTDASNVCACRTDPNDVGTEKNIPAGLELTIRATSSGDPVFQANEVVCWLKPAAGNGPACVSFTR